MQHAEKVTPSFRGSGESLIAIARSRVSSCHSYSLGFLPLGLTLLWEKPGELLL